MKLCVIGLGNFGFQLATSLADKGHEIVAIDKNEQIIELIKDQITQAFCAEILDEDSLQNLGIQEMDTVVVAIGENFAQSVLITALLKKMNVPLIIARATTQIHETILKLVGANQVLVLEREMAIKLANKLSMPLGEMLLLTPDFAITQMKAPKAFVGSAIKEITKKKDKRVSCIAVEKGGKILLVGPEYIILNHDTLIFAGEKSSLTALMQM